MYTVTQRNTAKFSLLFVIATSIYSCNKQQSSDSQEKYENLVLEAAACGLDITEIEEVKKNLSAREDQQEYTSKLKKINKVAFSEVYLQYHAINEMVDFLNTMRLKDGNNDFIKTKLDYFNNEKNDLTKLVIDMKKNNALLHLDSKNTNKKPLLNTFDASKKTINTIDSVSKKIEIHHLTENELNKLINYENIINKNATKNYTTSKLTKVKKYAYKGVEKFASGANKYNVLMNFVTMPNAFSNINSSFQNGNIGTGIKDSLHLGTNNADLALDLFKASRSAAYWNGHQNTFKNITKVQVAFNISSAGINAMIGESATLNSIKVAKENNLDLSAHIAKQLTIYHVKQYELILVMEEEQKKWIEKKFPFSFGKVHLIGKWNNEIIYDPYQKPYPAFVEMAKKIDLCLLDWLEKFK